MVFYYEQLKSLVDLEGYDVHDIVDRLTFAGFEVEELRRAGDASRLISGRILTVVDHPDSDHLHVLNVDLGPVEGTRQIVCGAPNVRVGMHVAVALPGCVLPVKGTTIASGTIRGVLSDGMCCSLEELGVPASGLSGSEATGITDLGDDYPVGDTELLQHLGLDSWILDINVLPNRPDCLCYLGIAREIAALTGARFIGVDEAVFARVPVLRKASIKTKACSVLGILSCDLGRRVNNEEYRRIQRVLQLSGHRPISPVVDLGNYVMLLTGQPFHIYDADLSKTNKYVARDDIEGEIAALDGSTYSIQKGDICIADSRGEPLCIAGIIGGASSEDSESTRRIDVEIASFHHASIRHTSARLGVATASSNLFGKEVNPRACYEAAEVFAAEMKKLFPGSSVRSVSWAGRVPSDPPAFSFSTKKLNARLGSSYTQEEVDAVLKAYHIEKVGRGKVRGPAWRTDLLQQADVDEEVFRFYPADRIPLTYDGIPASTGGLTEDQRRVREVRDVLSGLGISEIVSFTLVSREMADSVRVFDDSEPYRVLNPLTKDREMVRIDLVPSMLQILDRNASRKRGDLSLYEISDVDSPKCGRRTLLCIGLLGKRYDQDLLGSREQDYYDLKGAVESVMTALGIAQGRRSIERSRNPWFHPGKSADIRVDKKLVATLGELHPAKFERPYLIAEVDLSALLAVRSSRLKQAPLSTSPSVRRDLSLELDGEVSFSDIERRIRKSSSLVREVDLFDSYDRGGERTLGVSLLLQHEGRTLVDSEVEEAVRGIVEDLTRSVPVKLRGSI